MATRAGLGRISRSSGIVRFVQGGVVKTFRCKTTQMTEPDLNLIESTLGLDLPAYYRSFMLSYPTSLAEQQPEWSDVTNWEFANCPKRVIAFNRYVRGCDVDEFFDDIKWPYNYFVIGSEQEQNWYFIDLQSDDEQVFLYHHSMGDVDVESKSLASFPDALIKWWSDVESIG